MQAGYSATAIKATKGGLPHIVVLGPSAALHRGGVAYFSSRLVAALKELDSVGFVTWKELYPRWLLSREIRIPEAEQDRASSEGGETRLSFSSPLSWRRTAHHIVAQRPRIVVLNWVHPIHTPIYAYLLGFIKRRSDAERIVICHNVLPHERFAGDLALVRAALRNATQLIVHSASEHARASSLLPHVPVRELQMPSFAALANCSSSTTTRPAQLLYFGAIRPYKGVDLLVDAMQDLRGRFPDATLTIAGQPFGRYGEELRERVASLKLDCVRLDFRYIPDAEIPALFERASAAVLPFREVTQSASLSLALGSPLPVVTTDLPALKSSIEASTCVWTARPNDRESLVKAITSAIESGARRTSVSPPQSSWADYAASLCGFVDE